MELMHLAGTVVLNDTYNANPDSVKAALETLRDFPAQGKTIAVLADMLELGSTSEAQHRAIGHAASRSAIDYLLTHGEQSRAIHEAATVPFKAHYDQKNILAEYLVELVGPGDVVLIKGSRSMQMEDLVTFLVERLSRSQTNPWG